MSIFNRNNGEKQVDLRPIDGRFLVILIYRDMVFIQLHGSTEPLTTLIHAQKCGNVNKYSIMENVFIPT